MKIYKIIMTSFVLLVLSGCASMGGSVSVNDCFVGGGTVDTETNMCVYGDGSTKPIE